jgi:hypothetical protein
MNTLRRRIAVPIAIVIALAVTPALSGCFGNPVKNIIEGATGGDLSGAHLPADFPADVPLLNSDVTYALAFGKGQDKVWSVIIKGDGASTFDQITSQLEGAGFTSESSFGGTSEDGSTGAFTSDKYTVLVVVTKDKDGVYAASYTVAAVKN